MVLPSKRKRGRERLARRQRQEQEEQSGADEDASRSSIHSHATKDTNPMIVFHQWSFEEGHVGIVLHTLSFLDVTVLVEKKQVCKKWQQLCTQAIDNKCPTPKSFKTNKELRDAVRKYCANIPREIEEIAISYGYPINKWKVQEMKDFTKTFFECSQFNENISSWDLSNAKTMIFMFCGASTFNQPLPWNTSNVTNMQAIFCQASSFNQSLQSWDTSNVTSITLLFDNASSYNQPLDSWDTRKIVNMKYAFAWASSFNQSLRNWVFHDDVDTTGMFYEATSYDQELPDALDRDVVFW